MTNAVGPLALFALAVCVSLAPQRAASQTEKITIDNAQRSRTNDSATLQQDIPAGASWSLFVEEDFLQHEIGPFQHSDRNYTMGVGLQWSGRSIANSNLKRPLRFLDQAIARIFGANETSCGHFAPACRKWVYQTAMIHGTAFSPKAIGSAQPVVGDRPWAFLLGLSTRSIRPSDSDAWSTELTLGTIGSPLGEWVQRGIHWTSRHIHNSATPVDPKGWPNQLFDSPLGMPTARYAVEYEWILFSMTHSKPTSPSHVTLPDSGVSLLGIGSPRTYFEIVPKIAGQIGYYTEGDFGLTARLGSYSLPFWQFQANPLGVGSRAVTGVDLGGPEWFLFISLNGRLIAYNELLTGLGNNRWTAYRLHNSEVEHKVGEGVFGGSVLFRSQNGRVIMLSLVTDAFRSHEFNTTPEFIRAHSWGSIFLTVGHPD